MKLTTLILLSSCLAASAKGLTQTVSLNEKAAPLQKIFKELQKQTGYSFVYTKQLLQDTKPVDVQLKNATLETALQVCLKDQRLDFVIINNTVVIKPKVGMSPAEGGNRGTKVPSEAHEHPPIDIHGRIVNEKGEPVAASIVVKGTSKGTSTNDNGEFELKGVDDNATLVISGVSIESFEVKVNGRTELVMNAKVRVESLNEVVVNKGYYSTTQKFNTGSVSKISSDIIGKQPVSNPLAALEGRMPGVQIKQLTGVVGGGFSVQIRGQNSITQGNDPLYIVDGVPFTSTSLNQKYTAPILFGGSPLTYLNPNEIESIEVLKDADATAIYGSRGGNGVVLITTKKGKPGKLNVEFNSSYGFGKVTRMLNLLSTKEYLQMRREAFSNDGTTITAANAPDLLVWDTTKSKNWQKELIGGTAQINDVQLALSSGNVNTHFIFGGNYHRETTVFPGNNSDGKGSARINLNHTTTDQKFKINLSTTFLADNTDILPQDLTGMALYLPPNTPDFKNADGSLNWPQGIFVNPAAFLLQRFKRTTNNFINSALASYQINKDLGIQINGGYNQILESQVLKSPKLSFNPLFNMQSGSATFSNNSIKTWIVEPQLNWNKTISNSQFDFLLGTTFQQDFRNGQTLYATGFSNDALLENIAAATQINVFSSFSDLYHYNAIYGRLSYNLGQKYVLNFTARRDGSSRFGPRRQFANFGSIGAAWIFSDEKVFQNNFKFISFGKLRGSYGSTGNDQIGDYQYLDTYTPTTYPYQNTTGLFPTSLFNPNYGWETTKKFELGLELGMFKDNFYLTVNYYDNRSSNQLVGYPLPLITGGSSVQYNLPAKIENKGLEINADYFIVKKSNFKWSVAANVTIPRNRLLEFPNLSSSSYSTTYVIGKSLFAKEKIHYLGVNPQTGIYQFEDFDKDGKISYPNDLQNYKQVASTFFGGFSTNLNWNKFQLDINLQFVKQTNYNYLYNSSSMPGTLGNQPSVVLQTWQRPGDITNIQKFSQLVTSSSTSVYTGFNNSKNYGDNSIGDASFIRLKNLYFSYDIGGSLISKLHLQHSKVYVQAQNLFTLTKYIGMDPENGTLGYLPPLKVLAFGIQLNF